MLLASVQLSSPDRLEGSDHTLCLVQVPVTVYSSRGPRFGLEAVHLSFIFLLAADSFYCAHLCFPHTVALCLFQKQDSCSFSTVSPYSIPYFQWSPLSKFVTEQLRTADLQKKKRKIKTNKQNQYHKQNKNPKQQKTTTKHPDQKKTRKGRVCVSLPKVSLQWQDISFLRSFLVLKNGTDTNNSSLERAVSPHKNS